MGWAKDPKTGIDADRCLRAESSVDVGTFCEAVDRDSVLSRVGKGADEGSGLVTRGFIVLQNKSFDEGTDDNACA